MTDEQMLALLKGDSPFNRARQQFSNWSGKIDQSQRQRQALSPIEMRKMEFAAVEAIVTAYLSKSDTILEEK